jgi:transmembrane sensor
MRDPAADASIDDVRREAASWIARMRGPDAERSRFEFERWRSASPLHRQMYQEMHSISASARKLGATALATEHFARRRRFLAWPVPALAIGATAGLSLMAASLALFLQVPRPEPIGRTLSSAVGQIRTMRLADGTQVILDADSEIATMFDHASRRVRLVRGRARFGVAPDSHRPFMVDAGNRTIVDRGTVFDVTVGREGVSVSLLRGAVEVRDRGATGSGGAIARLVPGQRFDDRPASKRGLVSAAGIGTAQWTKGVLDYDGAPLSDVIADVNRYSVRKIRLEDPRLGGRRVTGVFHASSIESNGAALAAVWGLRMRTGGNGDRIFGQ